MPRCDESRRRAALAPGVEHGHILVELRDKILRRIVAAVFAFREFPGREIVPAGAAGGLRVGRDDPSTPGFTRSAQSLMPSPDSPCARGQHDGARVGRGVVRQTLLPVLRDELGDVVERVHVGRERERDDVGGQAVDDAAGLLARAAVRLLDGDVVASRGFPVRSEGLVEINVELARRVVGRR